MVQRVETGCWTDQGIEQGTSEYSILWSWWSQCRQSTIGGTEKPCGGGREASSIEKRQTVWEGPGYGKPGGPVKSMRMRIPSPQNTILSLCLRSGKEAFVSGVNDRGEDRKQRKKQSKQEHSVHLMRKGSGDGIASLWFHVINNYC